MNRRNNYCSTLCENICFFRRTKSSIFYLTISIGLPIFILLNNTIHPFHLSSRFLLYNIVD